MRCVSRPSMLVIKPFNHLLDFPVLQKKMSRRWSKHGRPDPESRTPPSLGGCGVWTVWPPHWRCIGTTILSGILDLETVLPKKMYLYWVFEARRSSQGTFHACGRPLPPLSLTKSRQHAIHKFIKMPFTLMFHQFRWIFSPFFFPACRWRK